MRTDGTVLVIVGQGTNPSGQPEGWRAVLPRFPVGSEPEAPSSTFALSVAPNPSRGTSVFRFTVPAPTRVRLVVYDVLGREVAQLMDGEHEAGEVRFVWGTADRRSAGVYLYRLTIGEATETRRLTLLN